MKLICPKCSAKVNIKGSSRYRIFTCSNCSCEFRGIHADVSRLSLFVSQMIPFAGNAWEEYRETPCPHCRRIVYGPPWPTRCAECNASLPTTTVAEEQQLLLIQQNSIIDALKAKSSQKTPNRLLEEASSEWDISRKAEIYLMLLYNRDFDPKMLPYLKNWFVNNQMLIDSRLFAVWENMTI